MEIKDQTFAIIGACIEVHKTLGCGFLEAVYQDALEIEFALKDIPFVREAELEIDYKGHILRKKYYADFICYNDIIVELKAVDSISSAHISQVLNYLHATGKQLALLINFGTESLQYRRVINS